jgi:Leu/Phe-tRNA-protein transferase
MIRPCNQEKHHIASKEETMKSATAIKKFINQQGYNPAMNYPTADVKEIKAFKDACTIQEWLSFGQQACELLGETFEA